MSYGMIGYERQMKLNSQSLPNHIIKLMPKQDRPKGVAGMTTEEVNLKNELKSEKSIHDDIIAYLRRNILPYDHSRMDRASTNKVGQPDFSIYIHNRVLFLEIKRQGGKLSEDQIKRHAELEAYGNKVEVIYSYSEATAKILEFIHEIKKEAHSNEARPKKA